MISLNTVDTLAKLWRKTTPGNDDIPNRVFSIPQQRDDDESTFKNKYDETQKKNRKDCCNG